MYAAKNTAAGVAAYGENLDEHSPRKLALVGELRSVIEHDGLELHYQPKVEMATGRVIGSKRSCGGRMRSKASCPRTSSFPSPSAQG